MSGVTLEQLRESLVWEAVFAESMPASVMVEKTIVGGRFDLPVHPRDIEDLLAAVEGESDNPTLPYLCAGRTRFEDCYECLWFAVVAHRTAGGWAGAVSYVSTSLAPLLKQAFTRAERDRLWDALEDGGYARVLAAMGHSA